MTSSSIAQDIPPDVHNFICEQLDPKIIADDPLEFVLRAFPWGKKGTSLEGKKPDKWQVNALNIFKRHYKKHGFKKALRIAVASGHGIGKTTVIAWIVLWFLTTRKNPVVNVTANTEAQLHTKTWRELAKWHKMAINHYWFKWTATRFYRPDNPELHRANAITWSIHRPEAMAGAHEENIMIIFDEGSAIPDEIWDVCEGAMTTSGAVWIVFGNPTQNTGRFRECFGTKKHRWHTMQVDSRSAAMTDKEQIQHWLEDYGEDSDFFRIRVRGEFPNQATNQFISTDVIRGAMERIDQFHFQHNKVMAVDVAGAENRGDATVFMIRQGNKVLERKKFAASTSSELLAEAISWFNKFKPKFIVADAIGVGSYFAADLQSVGLPVVKFKGSEKAHDVSMYANRRAEVWDKMRQWLPSGDIPNDPDFMAQLENITYGYTKSMQYLLESKADMKARGVGSPDDADALSMTFAVDVPSKDVVEYAEVSIDRNGGGLKTTRAWRNNGNGIR